MPGENADFVQVDISDANYLRLIANDNGANGSDHAVYADAKLCNEVNETSSFLSVEEYNNIIKTKYPNQYDITGEFEFTLLKRELIKNVGQFTLNSFYNASDINKETIDWLMNNQDILRYYILGGKPDGGSYYNSLTELSRLYSKYKNDFNDKTPTNNKWYPNLTKGEVYKKMAISLSLTHSTAVGYWAQINHPSNRSDSLVRYAIYKDLYDRGKFVVSSRQDHTPWFEALSIEEMRYIMNNITDDEELLWLNEYTQKRIDAHPNQEEKYLQPHTYIAYVWPDFNNPIFHDPERKDYWDEKFEGIFSKYGVTYSTENDKVYKAWMSMRNEFGTGAVCGGISKLGAHIRAAHGTPASVISQPGHAAIIYYRKDENGNGYWTIDNDVSGWAQSGKTERLSIRMPLGWGNDSYVDGWAATYIVLAQEAMNDWDNYEKSEKLIMLADVYNDKASTKEEILKKSLNAQSINIDAWWELIKLYKSDSSKTEEDYYKLAVKMGEDLLPFPLPLYNLYSQIKGNFTSTEYEFKFSLLQSKVLNEEKNYTATDRVLQPYITRVVGTYLLGLTDTSLATFSFDGENAGKIILSSRFDGNGIRWDYSLDGKKTWKEVSFTAEEAHSFQLSMDEINKITVENDIYVHIVGLNYNEENLFKIDITNGTLPKTHNNRDFLYGNDLENSVIGADSTMEWRYSEKDVWTSYASSFPDLTGNKTVQVRVSATGTKVASDYVVFTFTEDNQPDTAKYIPVKHLTIDSFSTQSKDSGRPFYAPNAIDGNMNTLWHTDFAKDVRNDKVKPFIVIRLDEPKNISSLEFAQIKYKNGDPDAIKDVFIYVSSDGEDWIEAGRVENCTQENKLRRIDFEQSVYGQYVKVEMSTYSMFSSLAMVNLFEDTTVTTVGTFSFDGTNEKKIELIDEYKGSSWEYSVDGGVNWVEATGNEKELSSIELEKINEKDNIKIRITKDNNTIESYIDIGKQSVPVMPNDLYLNDLENRLIGVLDVNKLEWKIDDGKWNHYGEIEPVVIGTRKLYIRNRATGNRVASDALEYQFTEDNQPDTAKYIPIKHLSIYDFSSETVRTGNQEQAYKAIDGSIYTKWHSSRTAVNDEKYISIKLDEPRYISKIQYNKEDKYVWGVPKDGIVYTSMDGENWEEVLVFKDLYNPANKNALLADVNQKDIVLNESVLAQYVRIKVTKSCDYVNGAANGVPYNYFFSSTMLNLFEDTTKNTNVAPTAEVKYSTTEPTNQDVLVTLVNPSEEITITNNDGKGTYTFTKNGTFTFEFVDKDGNKGTVEAVVNWIDKEEIKADIAYNINTKTNQEVTATIAFNKENVTVKGGNTHTFTENGTYTFEYVDMVGNKGTSLAKVDWIDKKVPVATISYSTTSPTNQDVIATISFDEENVSVTNGTTYTFTNNGSYVFEFVDEAGNKGTSLAKVDWIDRTIPRATISYNITKPTNQDVIATVTFDKENVTVKGGTTYTFTENGTYTFEFVGPAGNKGSVTAKVDWIDKKVPVATITYSPEHHTNQNVVATITFDKENVTVTGGNTHTFTENGTYTFEFVGPSGNCGTAVAKVDWIDRTLPKATIKYSKNELTNQDVVATITFDKENVKVTGGNTHTFTENGEYEFEFVGPAGNQGTAIAKVDWIDKKAPIATVTYSNIHRTNKDVVATVTFDEENVKVTGGKTHTFTENGEYIFDFVDAAGNKGVAVAIVSWIDKSAPLAKVVYSTTEPTNKEVFATISFDEKVSFLTEDIYGEELSNNTYRFTLLNNIDSVVEYVDTLGNKGTFKLKVDWIDKEAPTAKIKYSKTSVTTLNVTATLIDPSEEITIINNDGKDTYTFTENGEFTFEFVDKVGNKGTLKAIVNNIDKTAATARLEYDITNPTNKDVTVTLVSDSFIEITNNDGKNTYTFTENGEFTFEFIDVDGNKRTAKAVVSNIDKKAPTATIISDIITPTNQDVIVTLVNPSEEITITNNDGKNTYTFTENGEFTFEYVDKAGNKGSSLVKVNNIDKVNPTASVVYSETEFTNKDVIVTLVDASEEITITNNDGKNTYTFTENGTFTFEFTDKVGNKGSVVAVVRNINKKAPTAKIEYSTIDPTNQDVVVKLVDASHDITITNNDGKDTYTFTENGEFTFEFIDNYGNKGSIVAVVANIDKVAPTVEVKYSTTDETTESVTVTITPSEEVTITNNDGKTTYVFKENGEFTFEYVDKSGNKGSKIVKVDWIKEKTDMPVEEPIKKVEYSNSKLTNQDVTITIMLAEGITITNNNGLNTYTFTDNGTFIFEYIDSNGNTGKKEVKVDWIDKVAPTAKVSYSTTKVTTKPVTVTITPSEKVTITNNDGKTTYVFTENGEFTFEFIDEAGNKGSTTVKVSTIKNTEPIITPDIPNNEPVIPVGDATVDNRDDDSNKEDVSKPDEDNKKTPDESLDKNDDKEVQEKLPQDNNEKINIKCIITISIIFIILLFILYLLWKKKSDDEDETNNIEKTK